jgi:hypothetical protein
MIGSSVNSPICGVNRLFYLRVRCKITVAVFLTLRWYLSDSQASKELQPLNDFNTSQTLRRTA